MWVDSLNLLEAHLTRMYSFCITTDIFLYMLYSCNSHICFTSMFHNYDNTLFIKIDCAAGLNLNLNLT